MIRPESLRLGDGGAAASVRGRAVQSSFLGTRVRVAVESPASSVPLMVAVHGEDPSAVPAEDSDVIVSWAPEDAILLDPAHDE
jgi:hypothetical protein